MPYLLDPSKPFTLDEMRKVLCLFQTKDLPMLQNYRNYYDGKQNIIYRKPSDAGKPCFPIVTNYCNNIVHNYNGYITGKPITYDSEQNIDDILDVLKYNDINNEDNELLRTALIYGIAYEINYIDLSGKQRIKLLDPRECVAIYDNTLDQNLLYVVRFWREDRLDEQVESYVVEVYTPATVRTYRSTAGFTSFSLLSEVPHFYNQVPITVFKLNEDERSIFDQVMTLQDAFNELQSSEVEDFASFCDSYMLLKGAIADDKDLEAMKKKRVLMMDSDCDASYLTKNTSDTQIQNMLQNIKQQICVISGCPDMLDEKFFAATGIALKLRLIGFENTSSNIETNMRKALQKRVELICSILKLTAEEAVWRDIDIIFTRNLPTDLADMANTVNQFRGLVSDASLLAQIPFVKDVDLELLRIKEQRNELMLLYNFSVNEENTEEDV